MIERDEYYQTFHHCLHQNHPSNEELVELLHTYMMGKSLGVTACGAYVQFYLHRLVNKNKNAKTKKMAKYNGKFIIQFRRILL